MALATFTHHSSARRRPGPGRRRASCTTPWARRPLSPGRQARCTSVWTTTGMCLPPGRHLSLRCGHSGGFCGTPRRTSWTPCHNVQILDVPVPQLGDQMVEFLQKIDAPALLEQVIAVPKISLDRIPQRSAWRRVRFAEHTAEQLVEVPTIVSCSSLQQQTADHRHSSSSGSWRSRRRGKTGLQGSSAGKNSTALG